MGYSCTFENMRACRETVDGISNWNTKPLLGSHRKQKYSRGYFPGSGTILVYLLYCNNSQITILLFMGSSRNKNRFQRYSCQGLVYVYAVGGVWGWGMTVFIYSPAAADAVSVARLIVTSGGWCPRSPRAWSTPPLQTNTQNNQLDQERTPGRFFYNRPGGGYIINPLQRDRIKEKNCARRTQQTTIKITTFKQRRLL